MRVAHDGFAVRTYACSFSGMTSQLGDAVANSRVPENKPMPDTWQDKYLREQPWGQRQHKVGLAVPGY